MNIVDFPRVRLAQLPTPLKKMENLSKIFNGPQLFIKRDDMTGLLLGGNKARKLEFLMGDACQKRADLIITTGRVQSNWVAQSAAAARKLGMDILLILCGKESDYCQGNYLLDKILGAKFMFVSLKEYQNNINEIMKDVAENYKKKGRKPYIMPRGGSSSLADIGNVITGLEIINEANKRNLKIDYVVTSVGSCGTIAGLLSAFKGYNSKIKTFGIIVGRQKTECISRISSFNKEIAAFLGLRYKINKEEINLYDEYMGEGYGKRTKDSIKAIEIVAQSEGIILDPVYTGKGMADLMDLIKKGIFNSNQNIIFLHTGGTGTLFANNEYFFNIEKTL